jgi:FMN phosphatase YigB (HAD superfamily)
MKIFIDFDDVIFNTRKFTVDYKKIFNSHGISEKIYEKYYYDYPVNRGKDFKKYHPGMHIREIGKNFSFNIKKLENDIAQFTKNTKKYIFKDFYVFIKQFRKEDLYLLSFPNIKFQKTKIKNSGISRYFKQSILTNGLKSDAIKKVVKNKKKEKTEEIYFIDDRLKHVEDVKRGILKSRVILLSREEGRHKHSNEGSFYYKATNLNEVMQIIKKEERKSNGK